MIRGNMEAVLTTIGNFWRWKMNLERNLASLQIVLKRKAEISLRRLTGENFRYQSDSL